MLCFVYSKGFFSSPQMDFFQILFFLLPHFTQIRDTSCLRVRLRGMRSTFAHTFESIAPSNIGEGKKKERKKAFVFPCEKWAVAQCDLKPAQHQFDKSGSRQKWQNRHYWSFFEMRAVCSGLVLIVIWGHVSILTQKSAQTWTQMLLFKKGHFKGSFHNTEQKKV